MKTSKLSNFARNYLDYYCELENEFRKTQKYVAFDKYNLKTYSLEYLKLMQAVCGEIDVVAKAIAKDIDPSFRINRYTGIQQWGYVLQNKLPQILSAGIVFNHNIRVIPWKNWLYEQYTDKDGKIRYKLKEKSQTPSWWKAYNSVKHARTMLDDSGQTNFTKANLHNVIQCFAALLILESEYVITLSGEQEPIAGVGNYQLFQPYYEQFKDIIY